MIEKFAALFGRAFGTALANATVAAALTGFLIAIFPSALLASAAEAAMIIGKLPAWLVAFFTISVWVGRA